MEFVDKIFENPGRSIKKLARILLICGLVLAVILFVIGGIKFLKGVETLSWWHDTFDRSNKSSFIEMLTCTYELADERGVEEGYMGRVVVVDAVWIALASLTSIPLYGFGCMVEDTAAIKKEICHFDDEAEDEEEEENQQVTDLDTLKELLDSGVITQEDFDESKKRLDL